MRAKHRGWGLSLGLVIAQAGGIGSCSIGCPAPQGNDAAVADRAQADASRVGRSAGQASAAPYRQWTAYGGTADGARYSSIDRITRDNVRQLQVAWTYDTGEPGGLQTSPIVVGDALYANTPTHKVIALGAADGRERWRFEPPVKSNGPNRGVTYWASGAERRIFAAADQFVYALDADTGRPIPGFGKDGRIDLREGLGRPADTQSVRLTTPGVIYRDLLIVGGAVGESLPASPGDIRAYDVRTGALRWTFHTIPHPGEPGYETWPPEAWTYAGGANNWAGMVVDEARGLVFVPTGSAAADFYGANRAGDNLYSDSLIALDAATGRRVWHFQSVRHDIWDRDFPAPPNLVTVTHGGRRIDAVAQVSKQGFVYLFDRANGTPLFPLQTRAYPASTVDGEQAAPTQSLPSKPAPFSRQQLTEETLTTRTPDARRDVLERFRSFRNGGQFLPLSVDRETIVFPGFGGGAEWGGAAVDQETAVLYVNANEQAWTGRLAPNVEARGGRAIYLRDCATCHRDNLAGAPPYIPSLAGIGARLQATDLTAIVRKGKGRMPGFPGLSSQAVSVLVEYIRTGKDVTARGTDARTSARGNERTVERTPNRPGERPADRPAASPAADPKYRFTGYNKFLDPEGYPAIAPPWGTLTAIDLNTGAHRWQIPLGEYPELVAKGMTGTGSESYGGPVVTAGGLLFIGATNFDRKFRAFDKATGALVWETTLPFSNHGTPAVYELNGRQFIVVSAGGGKGWPTEPSGGLYIAFALPPDTTPTP